MVSCTRVLLSAALAGSYNNNKYHLDTGLVLQCCGDTEQCGECHQVSPLCRHTCAETEQPRTQPQWEPRLPPLHDVESDTASIQTIIGLMLSLSSIQYHTSLWMMNDVIS